MTRIHGFPPLSDHRAELLILGSMPGKASLQAGQYYAFPRNAFWPIMQTVYGIDRQASYAQRCAGLVAQGIAVWDVLGSCLRNGSLDADIDPASIVANDFASFLRRHPAVRRIGFNGAMAQKTFAREVQPTLSVPHAAIRQVRLPSTSPANASFSFERKLAAWREFLCGC